MELPLRDGICLLDDNDAHLLDGWWWWSGRPARRPGLAEGRVIFYVGGEPHTTAAIQEARLIGITSSFPLHRRILDLLPYAQDPRDVDHINGDGLDNRRINLRITTRSQNLANTASRGGTSGFKGVSFDRRTGRWKAQITVDSKGRNLGRYDTEEEAALAYNLAAYEAWGEHARMNPVDPSIVLPSGTRGSSRYRGVSWDTDRRTWIAAISPGGKHRHLGRFATETEAALAYNAAALEAFGSRARLNQV